MVGEIILEKNIIIDARMVTPELHGIGRYTYELIKGISNRKDFNVKIIVNSLSLAQKMFEGYKLEFIEVKSKFLALSELLEIPLKVNKYKDYIYHTPSFSCSPFIKLKSYMTIHDLNHIELSENYSKIKLLYYKLIVKPFAEKSEKIFTVSEFSKQELSKWLNYDNKKIIVTYNGIEEKFKIINDEKKLEDIKKKYDLPKQFILYIGNQKKHKNLETLIKAMKKIEMNLVINGKPEKRIESVIQDEGINDKIKFIGYIEDEDLPYIYNLANVFVFPSMYEGFGLPPLEAMACGCKTIVANSTCLPEVVGNGAILVKTMEVSDYINKINNVLKKNKNEFLELGIKRASKFKWEKTIDKTVSEYR